MNGWLLSVIGVVFISIILDAIMPMGKTNIFIKSIFGIVFMYVVISPVIKLIKNVDSIDYPKYLENIVVEDYENNQLLNELQIKVQNHLSNNGIDGVIVEIKGNMTKNGQGVAQINVDLSNIVLNNNDKHIDKYKLITKLIMDIVKVSEDQIVYG